MIKLKSTKIIASTLAIASIIALNPIAANAEWKQDPIGWWNTEGSSWSVGWKEISGKWYYFKSDGYMEHDKVIDGYTLGSDGAWLVNSTNQSTTGKSQFGFDPNYSEYAGLAGLITGYSGTDSVLVIPSEINGVSVKGIDSFSFISTDNLTSLTIPNTVISIGGQAFDGCSNLLSVTIPSSVTEIGIMAFSASKQATFYVGNEKIKQLLITYSGIDASKIIITG